MNDFEQSAIFGPVLATMVLTLVVWIYMYVRRIKFLNGLGVDAQEVTPAFLAEKSPPQVSSPSDNLKNLFEIPVVFYALALYLFVTEQVDTPYVAAGWAFVTLRVLHSFVHCTFNRVMVRFYIYALSTIAVWFILLRAAIGFLTH